MAGLLEAAPDAMVCVDSDGRIVLVNAQAERLFGYPREELAGQLVEMLVPDASKAGHRALRAGYAADPRPRLMGTGLDLSGRRRDGTTFPAEISLAALDTDQGILISAAIRDVTQQRQAREDLRRTNQILQQLAYTTAHELRTPLRSLAGFSGVLMAEYADTLGEDGRGYLQRIEAASEHIGHVLDALMHLSRLAQAEISLEPVNLDAEAAAIAADLEHQDPARTVCFTIQQQAWALADRTLIREVLRNLLGNAWKFTAERNGATIEFGTTPAENARLLLCARQRRGLRRRLHRQAIHGIPAPAHHPRVPRHGHRPGQRAPDRRPAWRPHLGRRHGRSRRYVLLHPPARRTRQASGRVTADLRNQDRP
jgi:PAS domain S-box-containing protein